MRGTESGTEVRGGNYRRGDLGIALRLMRESRGLRQEEVALQAGVTRTMFSGYERGRAIPTLEVLHSVLDAMDADLSALQEFIEFGRRVRGGDPAMYKVRPTSATEEELAFRRLESAMQRWLGTLRGRVLSGAMGETAASGP